MESTRRIISRSLTALAATAAAVALSVVPMAHSSPPSPATPVALGITPIAIAQIPNLGILTSGLVVPWPYLGVVQAKTTPVRGQTEFSVRYPGQSQCGGNLGGASIRITYVNVTTGQRGAVEPTICPSLAGPPEVVATTGSGPVAYTANVIFKFNRPTPALPGAGVFVAP